MDNPLPHLSDEQLAVLGEDVRLVEACPGAGKTRAIVARYKQRSGTTSQGLALLSFTNAAIDEASQRCSNDPSILRSPGFVGTFDSFIHRYVVTPSFAASHARSPTYFPSWDGLNKDLSEIRVSAGVGVRLSNFMHTALGEIKLVAEALPNLQKLYFQGLNSSQQQYLIDNAAKRIRRLVIAGIYDSDSARHDALAILDGTDGDKVLSRLARRFREIIVDEFQDCSTVEHALLTKLKDAGINIVVVADPDQSIYGFRQAEPSTYASYRATLDPSTIVVLDENYRSSPVICSLISSLAESATAQVVSRATNAADLPTTIYLLAGNPPAVRATFARLCQASGVDHSDRMVLARSGSLARRWAASSETEPSGEGYVKQIVIQIARLRTERLLTTRKAAISRLESLLLTHFAWDDTSSRENTTQRLVLLGRDRAWLRMIVGDLVASSETWDTIETCKASLKTSLMKHLSEESIALVGTFKSKLAFPQDVWDFWETSVNNAPSQSGERWSTIHGAKGQEFGAVLLAAPNAAVVEEWKSGVASEERRIFYVGASRAMKLLAIAAPANRASSLKASFEQMGIAVTVERAT